MPHHMKPNGLPAGSGLYWKSETDHTQIWIRVSHKGVAKSFPAGTNEWKKALIVRKKIQAEFENGTRKAAVVSQVRIDELLNDYIQHLERKNENRKAYGSDTAYKTKSTINKHIRAFFGSISAGKLTTAKLNEYIDYRKQQYRDAKKEEGSWVVSINRELSYLRASMRLAMKSTPHKVSSCPHFPIDAKAEKLRARTGTISQEQYNQLIPHLAEHLKPIMPFVMYSGVRAKELKFIRKDQVNMAERYVTLISGETKAGPGRTVPIVDIAVEPLKKWMQWSNQYFPNCPWLFHYNGEQIKNQKTGWNKALIRAGLCTPRKNPDGTPKLNAQGKQMYKNDIIFHDARRTSVTIGDLANVTESDSSSTHGHRDIEVHNRYNQNKGSIAAAKRSGDQINSYLKPTEELHPEPKPAKTGILDDLRELVSMKKEGLLTEEEFKAMKAKLF